MIYLFFEENRKYGGFFVGKVGVFYKVLCGNEFSKTPCS